MFGSKFKKEITVDGMHCAHCASKVETALKGLDGVKSVKVNLAAKTVTIGSSCELDDAAIKEAVASAGFTVM